MAAFQSLAAANNICCGAESMRYLGTATFMLRENMHFEEVQKTNQKKPLKLNIKKSILGESKWVGDGEKENNDIVSGVSCSLALNKKVSTRIRILRYDLFFFF